MNSDYLHPLAQGTAGGTNEHPLDDPSTSGDRPVRSSPNPALSSEAFANFPVYPSERRGLAPRRPKPPELWNLPPKALERVSELRHPGDIGAKLEAQKAADAETMAGGMRMSEWNALPPIFGGLWGGKMFSPEPPYSSDAAAPWNRKLPLGPELRLTLELEAGKTNITVPIVRHDPQAGILALALRREPLPGRMVERHLADGSFAAAYEMRVRNGNGERWVVALHVDSNKQVRRALFLQSHGGKDAPGTALADFRFNGTARLSAPVGKTSALEELAGEIIDMVARDLPASDLSALARTSRTMSRKVGEQTKVTALLEGLAQETESLDDLNRILTNCARDARLRDLYATYTMEDPVASTRLTSQEKGHLFEMLAERLPSLDAIRSADSYAPYEEVEDEFLSGDQLCALARLMLLDANERLKPEHRGDLSSLENGRLFGNLENAVKAGVPIKTAIATFGRSSEAEELQDWLQGWAIGAAEVLVRTGSTWQEAADELGIAKDHPRCHELKMAAENLWFASRLGLESIEQFDAQLTEHQISTDDVERRDTMREEWRTWHGLGATGRLVEGESASDVYFSPDVPQDYFALHEVECFQVLHHGPAMIRAGCSPEDVIEGLEILHPVSCHLARRLYAKTQTDIQDAVDGEERAKA